MNDRVPFTEGYYTRAGRRGTCDICGADLNDTTVEEGGHRLVDCVLYLKWRVEQLERRQEPGVEDE